MKTTRHEDQLRHWTETVQVQLDTLSKPQATVLALWSFATVILQTASLSMASLLLAGLLDQKTNTVRQRLREFYKPKAKKTGAQRQELDVTVTFAPLTRWVLSLWPEPQIALALDPTLCRDRFACLAVSLVYQGGSIPLAWKILPANTKGAWMQHWKPLLETIRAAVPAGYTVLVLTDRGLYQKDLFRQIRALAFHPFMRLNKNGQFCPADRPCQARRWWPLPELLPGPGHYYIGRGAMFKTRRCRLSCTLVVLWEAGYAEPWYLITDLEPAACEGACYGLRAWIEQGFRCIKSGGCQWEQSRITECARMERLWLVYALSLLWTQALAGEIEAGQARWMPLALSLVDLFGRSQRRAHRRIQRHRLGFIVLLLMLIKGRRLPVPRTLQPDPWPVTSGCRRVQLFKEQLC